MVLHFASHPCKHNAGGAAGGFFVLGALALTAFAFAALPQMATAEPDAAVLRESATNKAAALFQRSAVAYRGGQFREAAELLAQAYELDPAPVLLYNQARAFEGLGDFSAAVAAYTRYLAGDPDAKDAPAIRERVANLKREISERRALEQTPQRSAAVLPWIGLGVGLAGATFGAVLRGVAELKHDQAVDEPVGRVAAALQDNAEAFAVAGYVALGVGGAIAIAGLSWGIADLSAVGSNASTSAQFVEISVRPWGVTLTGFY